jgi:tetratricopeptide (TPR) repeat protein
MRAARFLCVSAIAVLAAWPVLAGEEPAKSTTAAADGGRITELPPELRPLAQNAKEQSEYGHYPEAERIYREILEKAPDNLYALSNLGVVLFRAGKNKQAEEAFQRVLALAPEDGFSRCTLGIIYYQAGKYDEAVKELTKALAINPKNATAHNYIGLTDSQKGWPEVAEAELETATKLDPKYADAYFNHAVVLATRTPPDKENARKNYQRAVELGAERDTALEQLIGAPVGAAGSSEPNEHPAKSTTPASTPEHKVP